LSDTSSRRSGRSRKSGDGRLNGGSGNSGGGGGGGSGSGSGVRGSSGSGSGGGGAAPTSSAEPLTTRERALHRRLAEREALLALARADVAALRAAAERHAAETAAAAALRRVWPRPHYRLPAPLSPVSRASAAAGTDGGDCGGGSGGGGWCTAAGDGWEEEDEEDGDGEEDDVLSLDLWGVPVVGRAAAGTAASSTRDAAAVAAAALPAGLLVAGAEVRLHGPAATRRGVAWSRALWRGKRVAVKRRLEAAAWDARLGRRGSDGSSSGTSAPPSMGPPAPSVGGAPPSPPSGASSGAEPTAAEAAFWAEAAAHGRLRCPNIVMLLGIVVGHPAVAPPSPTPLSVGGLAAAALPPAPTLRGAGRALVFELLEGVAPLDVAALSRHPTAALEVAAGVAAALAYAHGQGVVHNDVRPANILVSAATSRPLAPGGWGADGGDAVSTGGGAGAGGSTLRGGTAVGTPARRRRPGVGPHTVDEEGEAGMSTLSVLSSLSLVGSDGSVGGATVAAGGVTTKLAGWSHATVTSPPPHHGGAVGGLAGFGGALGGGGGGGGGTPAARAPADRLWRTADGALPWTAPEALRGEAVGPPADVYAFGIVLWGLLTGVADPYAPGGLSPLVAAAEVARGGGRRRPRLPRGGGGGGAPGGGGGAPRRPPPPPPRPSARRPPTGTPSSCTWGGSRARKRRRCARRPRRRGGGCCC